MRRKGGVSAGIYEAMVGIRIAYSTMYSYYLLVGTWRLKYFRAHPLSKFEWFDGVCKVHEMTFDLRVSQCR
jgi:hypothetical protein